MRQYSLFFLFILGSSVSAESNPQVNVGGRLSNFLNIVQNFTDGTDNTVDDRIVDGIQSALQGLPNRTSNNTVGEIINSTLTNFWDRVQDLADGTNTEIDDTIVDTLTNASQTLREGLGNVLDLYQNATANGTGVVNRTKDFVDGFRNSTDETEPIGDQIIDGLTFVWNRIQDGLANSRDFINTMRPCHEIAPRCGLAGYRLRKGTPGTATCEEICSTFPVVRRDYECGVCGPAVPTAAPIPAPVAPVMPVAPTPVAPTPVAPPMVAPTPVAPPPTDPAPTAPAPVAAPTPVASPPTDPAPTPTVPTPTATPPTVPAPTASTPVAPPSSTASAPTDPATSFELTLEYGGVPDGDKVFFETAATRWQRIIKGDVPDYDTSSITKTPDHSDCTLPGTVDDIYLCVYYTTIDGVGGTAGNGGWQWRRTADANGNRIPVMGYMRFESVDIPDAKSQGWWQNLIIHELVRYSDVTANGLLFLAIHCLTWPNTMFALLIVAGSCVRNRYTVDLPGNNYENHARMADAVRVQQCTTFRQLL
jgi:hypothetical protein